MKTSPLLSLKNDLLAGIVVFLIALPLCLGIANASGVAPISGMIAGIVGGLVVAALSGSSISVSGPAAGMIVIVVGAIAQLGSFSAFLTAVVLAGIFQIVFSLLKAGRFAAYTPSSVIKGMLAAIGILLIVKQIPLALGMEEDGSSHAGAASVVRTAFGHVSVTAAGIALLSLLILFTWETKKMRRYAIVRSLAAPLVVVAVGIAITWLLDMTSPHLAPPSEHRVDLPALRSLEDLTKTFVFPDLGQLWRFDVWTVALTLAIVASLETLLSLEAVEQLDRSKRRADPNRELAAQGVGNLVSGALGGLPITSVIVRGSANVHAGARSKLSAIFHGALLLICMFALDELLNLIPLACLAAILLHTGFKLAKPSIFLATAKQGFYYFAAFSATIIGVIAFDLLMGILIGLGTCIALTLTVNLRNTFTFAQYDNHYLLVFRKDVSFLGKVMLRRHLLSIAPDSALIIDANHVDYIDPDIIEFIHTFTEEGRNRNIKVNWHNLHVDTSPATKRTMLEMSKTAA
ncbi:SulP family inorganic anion transporter [Herbaspirillum sp. RV1423]|uniref:SulP family inorganic anion transporter n=1 Tax=Herbaspirillum sp. RV1423 TaxID=1443993 RepID=UPI0004BC436A|nr:SulP family inorganic anion transporter [Herbaspirillum sp. RV1423]